jgi:hypothetical protein
MNSRSDQSATRPGSKEFAIAHFGTHDKAALITGIVVMLAAFAALIGGLAVRPPP